MEMDPAVTETSALVLEQIKRPAQVRIGCRWDGVARGLPLADAVAAEAGAVGQSFAREPDQDAGGMELLTGDANQRHGENLHALGNCRQRQ
jgi:hypothetical protein